MAKKRLAVLVELDETGHLRARQETDALPFEEFKAMAYLAIENLVKSVAENIYDTECREMFFDGIVEKIKDIRKEFEGE